MKYGITNAKGGGGKQLYQHNVLLTSNNSLNSTGRVIVKITNDDNTPFTMSTLCSWLKEKGFNNVNAKMYRDIGGLEYDNNVPKIPLGIFYDTSNFLWINASQIGGSITSTNNVYVGSWTFTEDNVIAL